MIPSFCNFNFEETQAIEGVFKKTLFYGQGFHRQTFLVPSHLLFALYCKKNDQLMFLANSMIYRQVYMTGRLT